MKYSLLMSAAVLTVSAPVFAEDEPRELDTVVVESSRLGQTLTEIGTTVDIITSEELKVSGLDFVLDAIAKSPSVTINQNGPYGGNASVRIRGASSGQTLVLIDGVPVGDPSTTDAQFNFARLDTESVGSIEILKGPQSVLWGSDAIGGVISITTKRPEEGVGGQVFGEYGSFSTFRGGASYEYGGEKSDLRLFANGITTDGISKADEDDGNPEDDGYESRSFGGRAGYDFAPNVRLDGGLNYTEAEADFDGFVSGVFGDADQTSETEELNGHARLTFSVLDDMIENEVFVGYSDIERTNFNAGAVSFAAQGQRFQYRINSTININEANKITLGIEREDAEADLNTGKEERVLDSAFGLYQFQPVSSLTLTAGVRVDDHDDWGTQTTGRLAAAWNPNELTTARASWGQGFKAPSIFQSTFVCGFFCGLTEANGNLQPEEADAFDIGVDLRTPDGKGIVSLTYFNTDVTNQIDFSFTAGYDNIVEVESEGVELSASYELLEWLSVSADYAYIDSVDGATGDQLVRVPEHSGDVQFTFHPTGPLSGAVLVRYNGEENNSPTQVVDAWTRVDLSGAYELNDFIEVYGRIENLFDEDYQQILGYGTPGVSGSLGVRINY